MLTFRPISSNARRWVRGLMVFLLLIFAFVTWLNVRTAWGAAALRYELTPAELRIPFGPTVTVIRRGAIARAYLLAAPTKGLRVNGTAVPGLYEGRWNFNETGPITLYATSTDRVVVLEVGDLKYGITPVNPEAFLQALQSGSTGTWLPLRGASPWATAWILLLEIPLVALVVVMVRYFVPNPASIVYILTDDGLEIRGGRQRHYIPYARITGVTVASPGGRAWRTIGASVPGLYWGDFSWKEAGRQVSLYATRLRPLVLVSTDRRTYGVSPADQERFVAELQGHIHSPTGPWG